MHAVVAFAKPFRMPDFFLISGLFLAQVIDRDWRTYLDRKVVHFAYFYVLWCTIQFAFKAPGMASELGAAGVALAFAKSFIEPFGTLWFIYLLPIFFVVTKLLRGTLAVDRVVGGGDAGNRADRDRLDRDRRIRRPLRLFLYGLLAGAARLRARAMRPICGRGGRWPVLRSGRRQRRCWSSPAAPTCRWYRCCSGWPARAAVIVVAVLLAKTVVADPIRYCGENSIVIYLGFFLPMAVARTRAAQERHRSRYRRRSR